MLNTLDTITLNFIVYGLSTKYLYDVPDNIVFPGVPVIINTIHDPVDPYTPHLVDDLVNEAAVCAERCGYTTWDDEMEDMLF